MTSTEKQKKSGGLRLLASRCLSPKASARWIKARYRKRLAHATVQFPLNPPAVGRVLILLPVDPLEAVHHTGAILSLSQFFASAECVLLCTGVVADFYRLLPGRRTVMEYDALDLHLFSRSTGALCRMLAGNRFDLAVVLEKNPGPGLLRALSAAGAACRIGVNDTPQYPFVNVHVRPSARWVHCADVTDSLMRTLGAPMAKPLAWQVPKEALLEMRHVLKEHGVDSEKTIIGLDGLYFLERFSAAWADALVERLLSIPGAVLYCMADLKSSPDALARLQRNSVGIIPPLSVAKQAALIQVSRVMICGNTINFQLGRLLAKPTIGVFSKEELPVYFKPAPSCVGIAYTPVPDSGTIAAIISALQQMGGGLA
jgi:ADP-heptose:LPS heptosyltransferase